MKDDGQQLRKSFYSALNGVITIPVADEKYEGTEDIYAILGDQVSTDKSNKSQFVTETRIDIKVICKKEATIGKKVVDEKADEILQAIKPTPGTTGITLDSPFILSFCKYLGSSTQTGFDHSDRFTIIKTLKFNNRITQ